MGKLPDRAQVLVLFKRETMAALFQAVEKAESRPHDEQHYVFLKRMVQILVRMFLNPNLKRFLGMHCFITTILGRVRWSSLRHLVIKHTV